MIRLGKFTGKLYDNDADIKTIQECCVCLNYKNISDIDESFLEKERIRTHEDCLTCFGCPESRKIFNTN